MSSPPCHVAAPTPAPATTTSSMTSFTAHRDVPLSSDLQAVLSYVSFLLSSPPINYLTSSPRSSSLPRSIQSSHLFLLALTVLIVSTLQAILLPTTTTVYLSDMKFPTHPTLHAPRDEFTSFAIPILDSIDSISSPAVIMSWTLILVGTLVRGAENVIRSLGSKGHCC